MKKLLIVLISVLSLSYACTKSNDPQPTSKNGVALFDPYSFVDGWSTAGKLIMNWKNVNNLSDNLHMNSTGDILTLNNVKYVIKSHSPNYDYIDYYDINGAVVNIYIETTTGPGRRLNTFYNYTYVPIKTYKL
jgi:hypothetical protein